jgi:hypothetical protein
MRGKSRDRRFPRATLLWQEAKFSRHAYYLLLQEYNVTQFRVRDGGLASAKAER